MNAKKVAQQNLGRTTKESVFNELRLGVVTRVDNERQTIDIQWMSGTGGGSNGVFPDAPITSMMWSPRSFMGMTPEIGAGVICGYVRLGGNQWIPFPLAYFPRGFIDAKNFVPVQNYFEEEMQVGDERVRARIRKVYPGEGLIQSTHGGEIVVNKDILLSNQRANEFIIRASDQSILQRALNHYVFGDGVALRQGLIIRNDLIGMDDWTSKNDKQLSLPVKRVPIVLPDGKRHLIITQDGKTLDRGGVPFTEWRLDLQEFGDGVMDVVKEIDGAEVDSATRSPFITLAMGTLVGNDPTDQGSYGQVLAPSLAAGGKVVMETVDVDRNDDAAAFYLKVADYQFAVNKSGDVFTQYPGDINASYSKGLRLNLGSNGDGESLNVSGKGSVVISAGREAIKGGRIGKGLILSSIGAMYITVSSTDATKLAMNEKYAGTVQTLIEGDWNTRIKGNYNLTVDGLINERILGKKNEQYVQDKSVNYGGSYSKTIVDHDSSTVGGGKAVTIAKPKTGDTDADSTTVLLGNSKYSMLLGNFKITTKVGNVDIGTLAGNVTLDTLLGNVSVGTEAGNVTVSTLAGNVEMSTVLGTAKVSSSLQASLESLLTAAVKAPIVKLGAIPAQGGVVTGPPVPSHLDYIVGLPLKGSVTVFATM